MKIVNDSYGFITNDLEGLAGSIGQLMGFEFVPHESLWLGDYYRFGKLNEQSFILQYNYNDFEEDWMQPKFTDYPILLYVSHTQRAEEIEAILSRLGELKPKLLWRRIRDVNG